MVLDADRFHNCGAVGRHSESKAEEQGYQADRLRVDPVYKSEPALSEHLFEVTVAQRIA